MRTWGKETQGDTHVQGHRGTHVCRDIGTCEDLGDTHVQGHVCEELGNTCAGTWGTHVCVVTCGDLGDTCVQGCV